MVGGDVLEDTVKDRFFDLLKQLESVPMGSEKQQEIIRDIRTLSKAAAFAPKGKSA